MAIETYGDALALVRRLDNRIDTSCCHDLLDLLIGLGVWSPGDKSDDEDATKAMVSIGYDQQFIVEIISDLKKVGFRVVKDN